jgi:Cdc6-like AAA superfamily ATPase
MQAKEAKAKATAESVKVAIRCRPMSNNEMAQGHTVVVEINKASFDIFVKRPFTDEAPKQFTFDNVYDWTNTQAEIYKETCSPIIGNILEGYNGTIFAYGQTGTGKTFTMTGVEDNQKQRGIMPRAFEDIFNSIEGDSVKT